MALLLVAAAFGAAVDDLGTIVRPTAKIETDPMPHTNDAADDPAIWVHPTDREKSLILGSDKQGGVHTYGLNGKQRQVVSETCLPNNVDVLYGIKWGDGRMDLAVASCRSEKERGVKIWSINAQTGELKDVTEGGVIPVFAGGHAKGEPYGICGYTSAKSGKGYFFVNNKVGAVEQYEMTADGKGLVNGTLVRSLKVNTLPEGCVADNELGFLYLGEERIGIWKFSAEPDAPVEGKLIHKVGEHGLTADVEGLTIYYAQDKKGYLIVSSQGNNTFKVYDRAGQNTYILTIDPAEAQLDDVNDTDGIDVINVPLGKAFPKGLFIVQDGTNKKAQVLKNQNFKLYAWEDIAGEKLLVDTQRPVRRAVPQR